MDCKIVALENLYRNPKSALHGDVRVNGPSAVKRAMENVNSGLGS